ncbi:MAG: alpha/beta hydrolase [Bacteroidetes bacterium SW_9_63_38]|nr:MAG: alpha/beta hydrolase [Bacteroidetes bacterium SW_9_63_38]
MSDSSDRPSLSRTLLAAGGAAAGAYVGLAAARWWHRRTLPPPSSLPPALSWRTRTLETPHGRSHCYVRSGERPPIVLLHSVNAVASTFELKPVAEHLATTTDRTLYAIDWLGFGRSDRPALDYEPSIYADQLYQVLTDLVEAPADLIGLSLGCEYAAWMALQAAPQVRRLALLSPTGLTTTRGPSAPGRLALNLAGRTGAFELFFYRLARRASLQQYYTRQVFGDTAAISDALLDYAESTAHVRGAPHAPQRFVQGALYLDNVADEIYGRLYRPTLVITPEQPGPTVQSFDLLPRLLDRNARDVTHKAVPGGLMPQWETPNALWHVLDDFLATNAPPPNE